MRAYFLGNYYLSSIQQGIQAAHCAVDMAMKYSSHRGEDNQSWVTFCEWAEGHKTMVLLNGGNQSALNDFAFFLNNVDNPFPWEQFFEDEQSLNNALTCVGIILPERIYEAAALLRQRNTDIIKSEDHDILYVVNGDVDYEITVWEKELCERLNQCGLAK